MGSDKHYNVFRHALLYFLHIACILEIHSMEVLIKSVVPYHTLSEEMSELTDNTTTS